MFPPQYVVQTQHYLLVNCFRPGFAADTTDTMARNDKMVKLFWEHLRASWMTLVKDVDVMYYVLANLQTRLKVKRLFSSFKIVCTFNQENEF